MPAVLALCLLAVTAFIELKYARPNQASMRVEAGTAAQAYVDENPEKIVMFAHMQGLLTRHKALFISPKGGLKKQHPGKIAWVPQFELSQATAL